MNLRIIDGGLIHTYSTLANCCAFGHTWGTGGLLTRYPTIDCMVDIGSTCRGQQKCLTLVWHGGLVVSTLGMRTQRPRFESRVAPLFHWVATLGKLFTHIASPVSHLQETGVQKGVFGA